MLNNLARPSLWLRLLLLKYPDVWSRSRSSL
jgi:hypothetical protein